MAHESRRAPAPPPHPVADGLLVALQMMLGVGPPGAPSEGEPDPPPPGANGAPSANGQAPPRPAFQGLPPGEGQARRAALLDQCDFDFFLTGKELAKRVNRKYNSRLRKDLKRLVDDGWLEQGDGIWGYRRTRRRPGESQGDRPAAHGGDPSQS